MPEDPLDGTNIVKVTGAFSIGSEGNREIADNPPDVVIVDLGLPDIPGVKVIERNKDVFARSRYLSVYPV